MMMAFLAPRKHLPWLIGIFGIALVIGAAVLLAR